MGRVNSFGVLSRKTPDHINQPRRCFPKGVFVVLTWKRAVFVGKKIYFLNYFYGTNETVVKKPQCLPLRLPDTRTSLAVSPRRLCVGLSQARGDEPSHFNKLVHHCPFPRVQAGTHQHRPHSCQPCWCLCVPASPLAQRQRGR